MTNTLTLPKDLVGGWTEPATRTTATIEDKCEKTIDQLDKELGKYRAGDKTRWFLDQDNGEVRIHIYYSTKRLSLGSDKKGNPTNHIVATKATLDATLVKIKKHIRDGWLNGPIDEESQKRSDAKKKPAASVTQEAA